MSLNWVYCSGSVNFIEQVLDNWICSESSENMKSWARYHSIENSSSSKQDTTLNPLLLIPPSMIKVTSSEKFYPSEKCTLNPFISSKVTVWLMPFIMPIWLFVFVYSPASMSSTLYPMKTPDFGYSVFTMPLWCRLLLLANLRFLDLRLFKIV